ncbi:MAG TPA: hypothetical protein VM121_12085 [Acidimicrobiales bacterium]|nr:hypothetical protein [Acidimicrobiales bacterium]
MTCPKCRGANLVEIRLTLHENHLTMHSCAECDSRFWDREGEQVPLGQVLSLAR